MAINFDPSLDYLIFDGLESIEVFAPGADESVTVENVLRMDIRKRDANAARSVGRDTNAISAQGSGGAYVAGDIWWNVPYAELDEAPKLGTRFRPVEGKDWIVLDIRPDNLTQRWECQSRNLEIAERFNSRVTIQIARASEDANGTPRPLWVDWKAGVLARISPSMIVDMGDQDVSEQDATHVVVLGEAIDFTSIGEARLIDERSRVYKIQAAEQYERLEFLPQLTVKEVGIFHQG